VNSGQNNSSLGKVKKFTEVPNLKNIVMISAGNGQNMSLNLAGEVYAWGANTKHELGFGINDTYVGSPKKVESLSNIRYVSSGNGNNVCINKTGEVFGAGDNNYGALGLGNNSNIDNFQSLNIANAIQISSGNTYTSLVKEDGTVWGTGDLSHGDIDIQTSSKSRIWLQVRSKRSRS
jgi:alpha-tubulin suppressor-like RCC1 family protein